MKFDPESNQDRSIYRGEQYTIRFEKKNYVRRKVKYLNITFERKCTYNCFGF